MNKPLIGITMGDPAGIGPETIVGAWKDKRVHQTVRPIVVGHPLVIQRAAKLLPETSDLEVVLIDSITDLPNDSYSDKIIHVLQGTSDAAADATIRTASAAGGQAAYDCLVIAAELAKQKKLDGIVTAPLNKKALHAAGKFYPGHTELLAELCEVDSVAMLLYLAPDGNFLHGDFGLGVAHVTLHMPMREIFDHINEKNIIATAKLLQNFFIQVQSKSAPPALPRDQRAPRIAIAALNCHGGESGLFGDEEQTIIAPAVAACRQEGMDATGPVPIDTLIKRAADGEFDGVVAMYHDQGHIPLKLVGMHSAVNITLGLPIVRTSVAHGTAFDIAWQGKMNPNSMVEAILVAAKLIK